MTSRDGNYSLAHKDFDHLWEEGLYNLDRYGAGHCYTYNPPFKSLSGFAGHVFGHLGSKNDASGNPHGYYIYLHDRGQFWQGTEMDRIGQSKPLFLPSNFQWEGSLKIVRRKNLNKLDNPCEDDNDYSFSSCIFKYIATTTGCNLDWYRPTTTKKERRCSTNQEILRYNDELKWTINAPWFQLSRKTGCLPKCQVTK